MNGPASGIDVKARVLQETDIVTLIGQSVALKRRGKDYVGLCPFHQEKTPSFHVSPGKQFFHCYGCKAGGNAIDFVIRRDRIEFIDAMKLLAEQAGIELPHFGRGAPGKENTGERQVLYDAHSAASALFEKLLQHPEQGSAAREYLEKRGIVADSIKRFRIGFAPDSWDALLKNPAMRKFSPQQLASAGLVKPRSQGEGFYDTFRNRVMFPIRDESGRVIAFGGRVMPGSDDPAKYLNSPETSLFSKGRCIFGLDLARQKVVETRTVAVVEGYTDVVMAHQFGVTNVVSILGTAMTEQHVAILRRFADRIVLLFDADTAGDAAVSRAVELFLTQPVEIAIASLPEALDPDEYLLKHGAEAFEKVLSQASDALSFRWKQLDDRFKASDNLTGRQKAVEEYLTPFAAARGQGAIDAIRWGSALARVNRLTGVPLEELNRRFKLTRRSAARAEAGASPNKAVLSARDRAERQILGVLMQEPQRWHRVQQHLSTQDFSDEKRQRLAEVLWHHLRDEGEATFAEFLSNLTDASLTELAVELVDETDDGKETISFDQMIADGLSLLEEFRRREKSNQAMADYHQKEQRTAEDEISLLSRLQDQARVPDLRRI